MSVHVISAVLNCRNAELSCARRMVLVVLADHASGEDARCWPSQQLVADEAGCGIRTVKSHIKWLEDNGYIIRTTKKLGQGNGSRTSYKICLSRLQSDTIDRGAENAGANIARANSCTLRGEKPPITNRQEPSIDTSNEVSRAKPRGKARATRLSDNWSPTPNDYAFASKEGLSQQEINREADKFRDYWPNISGAKGRKIDWSATWRNWIRRAADGRKPADNRSAGPRDSFSAFDKFGSPVDGPETVDLWQDGSTVEGEFTYASEDDAPRLLIAGGNRG